MASTSDIRDIMNLGQAGPRQPAPKKKKISESQPRVTGVRREVQALMGDSVPPIAIVEQRSYKSRPSISQKSFKPRHWEERPFQHGGRMDGLVLRHWKRSIVGTNAHAPVVANGSADVEMTDDAKTAAPAVQEMRFEDDLPSHKWNVKVQVPSYTDDQYENMLKVDDWSRQETDYLMDLCRDYDLRWIVIADRYTPEDIPIPDSPTQAGELNGTEVVTKPYYPGRTMESLKQRYYTIAAKIMEIATPASTMTATEFQLWEKMRTFDAKTETMRKAMAEKLFERTKDEADEERILLEELHRITKNEDDFIKMRRDLYARLEPVAPLRRSGNGEEQSTAMYQTSSGLSMLLQSLLAKEKRLKRPPMPEGASAGASSTPADPRHEKGRQSSQYGRRDTIDTQGTNDEPHKKSAASQAPAVRVLSPAEAAKFGVSHPQERLTSGIQFRHEKINRLTMAKSQTQTTKIQAALTELGIPARLLMPTERVCREFERLVGEINVLLDCRKVNEKVAAEVRILEEQRRIRLGLPKEGEMVGNVEKSAGSKDVQGAPNATDAMEIDDSQVGETSKMDESMAVAEEDEDAEAEDDEPTQASIREDQGQEAKESTMQGERQDDEEEEDDDDDGDAEDDTAAKPGEDEDEEEDQNDEEATGVDNEEDEDEDAEAEDQPQLNVDDEDEDEEEEEEDEDEEEVTPTLQEDSDDDEPDADSDEEAEAQAEADSEEDEQEAQDDADEDESDAEAEAQAQAAAEASSDEDQDSDDEEAAPSGPQVNEDDSDEDTSQGQDQEQNQNEDEDEDEDGDAEEDEEPAAAPIPAIRAAHKRSASVISEASRAGSNRSGAGRKKRR